MAAAIPDAPLDLTMVSQSSSEITISWTAPYNGGTPLTNYRVQWNKSITGSDFIDQITLDADTLTYTETELTAGETYTWKIIAVNVLGSGPESTSIEIIAATVPETPA